MSNRTTANDVMLALKHHEAVCAEREIHREARFTRLENDVKEVKNDVKDVRKRQNIMIIVGVIIVAKISILTGIDLLDIFSLLP